MPPAPPCPKSIIIPTTKEPKCNCALCSATVGKPKKSVPCKDPSNIKNPCKKKSSKTKRQHRCNENNDDIPCIKPVSTGKHDCGVVQASEWYHEPADPSSCSRSSRREEVEEEDTPCRKKTTDIIRRNKLAVKILNRQLQAVKSIIPPCCDSRYSPVQLFPAAKHAMRWAPAYSLARTHQTCKKKGKKPPPKKPIAFAEKSRNCACEVMANAIKEDVTHHLGLSEQRKTINKTPPPSPSNVTEVNQETK